MKILFYAPTWLGDAVMSLSLIDGIQRVLPKAEVHVAAPSLLAELFEAELRGDKPISLTQQRKAFEQQWEKMTGRDPKIKGNNADMILDYIEKYPGDSKVTARHFQTARQKAGNRQGTKKS